MIETSDVPAGVINIVTGDRAALAKTLAEHDGVDALWFAGDAETLDRWSRRPRSATSSRPGPAAASTTTSRDKAKFEGDYFLRRATQVKNVWVPYGA